MLLAYKLHKLRDALRTLQAVLPYCYVQQYDGSHAGEERDLQDTALTEIFEHMTKTLKTIRSFLGNDDDKSLPEKERQDFLDHLEIDRILVLALVGSIPL